MRKGFWKQEGHNQIYGDAFKNVNSFELKIEKDALEKHMKLFWLSSSGNCDIYEFGVYTGGTLSDTNRQLIENGIKPRKIWGFDSFEGHPSESEGDILEGPHWKEGAFSACDALGIWEWEELSKSILERIGADNAALIKGFYSDLNRNYFLENDFRPAMFINIDCNLYSSAKSALDWIFSNGIARPGSIIRYDDILRISEDQGELLAHKEMCEKHGIKAKRISSQYFLVTSVPDIRIKYAISSHIGSYDKTMIDCCESLIESGINPEDIYFFIGGHTENEKIHSDIGINAYLVGHNSMDLTGLISVLDLKIDSDYWFLLHDTIKAGKRFNARVRSFEYNTPTIAVTCDGRSMNMGAYSMKYLMSIEDKLILLKNTDYSESKMKEVKKNAVDQEDQFLPRSPAYNRSKRRYIKSSGRYGTGVERIIEYFEEIDLFKFKANWGVKKEYELKL